MAFDKSDQCAAIPHQNFANFSSRSGAYSHEKLCWTFFHAAHFAYIRFIYAVLNAMQSDHIQLTRPFSINLLQDKSGQEGNVGNHYPVEPSR